MARTSTEVRETRVLTSVTRPAGGIQSLHISTLDSWLWMKSRLTAVLMCSTISELNRLVVQTEHSFRCQCRLWNTRSLSVLSTSQVQIITTSKYLLKIVHSNGRWGWSLEKLFIQICVISYAIALSAVWYMIVQNAAFSFRWEISSGAKNSECLTS